LKVFVQVGSVKAAREVIEDGADVIVVQSTDAAGHQFAQGASLIALLPEVVDMLRNEFEESQVCVIAAGGIMDGRGIAAAQALGRDTHSSQTPVCSQSLNQQLTQ
jgi:nitronate monooxygenase